MKKMPWRCNKDKECNNPVCTYREHTPYNSFARHNEEGESYRFSCSYANMDIVTLTRTKEVIEYKIYKKEEGSR